MIVYKTTNKINGKLYIGQDSHNDPKYLGSGMVLRQAIKKYGKENFVKETVAWCHTREHLDWLEMFYIQYFNTKTPNGYNLRDGGEGRDTLSNHPNKKDIYQRISKTLTGRPTGRCGPLHPQFGKHHTEDARRKMRENSGVKSLEVRNRMSKSHKGVKRQDQSEFAKNAPRGKDGRFIKERVK